MKLPVPQFQSKVLTGPTSSPYTFGPAFNKHWVVLLLNVASAAHIGITSNSNLLVSYEASPQDALGICAVPLADVRMYVNGTTVPVIGGGIFQPFDTTKPAIVSTVPWLYVPYPNRLAVAALSVPADLASYVRMVYVEDDVTRCLGIHVL